MILENGLNQQGDSEEDIANFCGDTAVDVVDYTEEEHRQFEEDLATPKILSNSVPKLKGLKVISQVNRRKEAQKLRRAKEKTAKNRQLADDVLINALADSMGAKVNGAEPKRVEKVGGMFRFVEGV